MKEYTDETIRLRANESMLNSKGFLLFSVCQDGSLEMVGCTENLTPAERHGLYYYRKTEEPE